MTTSVRLPEELEKKLTAICSVTGRKKSSFIIEALAEHIQDLEDYYIVAKRMQDYDKTESVSFEYLKGLYEMED